MLDDPWGALGGICDKRQRPIIPAARVARSLLVMMLTRLGSFHALEQTGALPGWARALGGSLPSADTIARSCTTLDLEALRRINRDLHAQLKRRKALQPLAAGLVPLVVDAHESHASYNRHCQDCLKRQIKHKDQSGREYTRTQYYHRYVAGILVTRDLNLLLDEEPIRPDEGEIAAAVRLVTRLVEHYPRAFDIVLGDGLYARADFFNPVSALGKYVLAVLKDENRDLMADLRSLLDTQQPLAFQRGDVQVQAWDLEGFETWPQVNANVRVIRTLETTGAAARRVGSEQTSSSEWVWVTTAPKVYLGTIAGVYFGHSRWTIENEGFNEIANAWHADHVYTHHPHAMRVCLLTLFLAYNIFHAFWQRNLKPAVRLGHTMKHIAAMIAAQFRSAGLPPMPARAPDTREAGGEAGCPRSGRPT